MAYWSLFFRLIVRPVLRERARSILVVFAVALGVSVVLAIDLAGNAAAGSFRSSMETLAGDDDLEVTAAGGVPEQVVGQLATLPYALHVTPRIEDHATVSSTGATVPLIGIDVIAEGNRHQSRNLETPGGPRQLPAHQRSRGDLDDAAPRSPPRGNHCVAHQR